MPDICFMTGAGREKSSTWPSSIASCAPTGEGLASSCKSSNRLTLAKENCFPTTPFSYPGLRLRAAALASCPPSALASGRSMSGERLLPHPKQAKSTGVIYIIPLRKSSWRAIPSRDCQPKEGGKACRGRQFGQEVKDCNDGENSAESHSESAAISPLSVTIIKVRRMPHSSSRRDSLAQGFSQIPGTFSYLDRSRWIVFDWNRKCQLCAHNESAPSFLSCLRWY